MEIFIYAIIFIIGTFFGSFFTLAVYRIPRKEDILIKHSYCPNCNHELGFFDLFPILSYVLLGGKCRYCKTKIRPRYLILELLSGFTFLILGVLLKVDVFSIKSILNMVFLLLYVSILFIIAGIDKEKILIEKNVLMFGYAINVLYIIYQYALGNFSVYQYVIYWILSIISLIIINLTIKERNIKEYIIQLLLLSIYIINYSRGLIYILTIICTLATITIWNKLYKKRMKDMPIGFLVCISNIIIITISRRRFLKK